MRVAVLGGTGRTGKNVVRVLNESGHAATVLARAGSIVDLGSVRIVRGTTRDIDALRDVLHEADAVISALGPVGRDPGLMGATAEGLQVAMREAHVDRFVGVSVAGLTLPGDQKRPRDSAISWVMETFGGQLAADRRAEYDVWSAGATQWTLFRVPRLVSRPAGPVDVDEHRSGRRSTLSRDSLARVLVSAVEERAYIRSAPFVSDR